MRTNRLAVVVLGLALVALQAQGWAADKEKKPLKYAGKVYVQVRAAEAGAGIPGAKVQVLDDRVGKPELLSGVTDASGCCLVAAPVGYSSEEVDWERVGETSLAGLVVGLFGGLNKKDCIVRFNGVAVSITADGYKPFRGFVPYQDINGKAFEAVAQPVLLEKASSPAVSRIDSASRMTEFEWLQCPDELPAGAAVPVKFRFLYKHPAATKLSARGTVDTSTFLCKWQPLFDDGKHDDGAPDDGIWGGLVQIPPPPKKNEYPDSVLSIFIEISGHGRPVTLSSQELPFVHSAQTRQSAIARSVAGSCLTWDELLSHYQSAGPNVCSLTKILSHLDRVDEVIAAWNPSSTSLTDEESATYASALYRKGLYDRVVAHVAAANVPPISEKSRGSEIVLKYYAAMAEWRLGKAVEAVAGFSELGTRSGYPELDSRLPPMVLDKSKSIARWSWLCILLLSTGDVEAAWSQAVIASSASSKRSSENWMDLGLEYLRRSDYARSCECFMRASAGDVVWGTQEVPLKPFVSWTWTPERWWTRAEVIMFCQERLGGEAPAVTSEARVALIREDLAAKPESWRLHHDLALLLMKAGPHQDTGKELTLAAWHGKSLAATRDKMAGGDTRMMYGTRMVDVAPVWTSEKLTVYNGYADPVAQADFYISDICSSVPGFSFASGLPQLENSTEDQALQPVYAYVVGRALTDIGCARLAVPFMDLALAQLPDSVEVHLAAAEMKLALGLQDEAAALQNKARSLAPDDPSIAERIASMAGSVQQN